MKSLPDLIVDAKRIAEELSDPLDTWVPYDLEILKDRNELAIKEKVDSYYSLMKHFEREASMWEEQERMCKLQRQKFEKINDRLKDRLKECMKLGGVSELEGNMFRFINTPMKPKLVIQPGAKIPENFTRIVQTLEVDKEALRYAIEQGEIIDGVTLEPVSALRKYP